METNKQNYLSGKELSKEFLRLGSELLSLIMYPFIAMLSLTLVSRNFITLTEWWPIGLFCLIGIVSSVYSRISILNKINNDKTNNSTAARDNSQE